MALPLNIKLMTFWMSIVGAQRRGILYWNAILRKFFLLPYFPIPSTINVRINQNKINELTLISKPNNFIDLPNCPENH